MISNAVQENKKDNKTKMSTLNFGLYVVATPIGNLKDISNRAIELLTECDYIICENPKHSLKLLNKLGIKKKLISLHDHNEELVISRVKNSLKDKIVVLISDAGSPLISDPGFKLIRHCYENNVYTTTVPGPSSIISALQLSSLPINEFYFSGFFPKTTKHMNDFINGIKDKKQTVVFFVSSNKLNVCLDLLDKIISKRLICVCKELTKINEKIIRGSALEVKKIMISEKNNHRGEFVIVIGGDNSKKIDIFLEQSLKNQIVKLLSKFSLTDVVEIVHKLTNLPKNKIYKWVLEIKNG